MQNQTKIKLTLVRSLIGTRRSHKSTVVGLGLRKVNSVSIINDTPSVRGMIDKVAYLLKVEA